MPRLSIKTKFMAVIGLLVGTFVIYNAVLYPRRVEAQIRHQSQMSARQVVETASYALAPALGARNQEDIARVLEGVKNIPAFSFSAVFDEQGQQVDSTPATPAWVREYRKNDGLSRAFT
ncbi:MAG TPA: hypothetical protein PKO12_07755, partial [Holophaga sp.]|nr:hypothetical protein [Holophaga sp.]